MVNPIYIFIILLSSAFLLPVIDKLGRKFSLIIFIAAIGSAAMIIVQWLPELRSGGAEANIFTAGFIPPFSINLRLNFVEAFILVFVNSGALLSAFYLIKRFFEEKIYAQVLFLTLLIGINGLVMTRDLFNVFVFLEITSISLYALIGLSKNKYSLAAGFKYIIASGLASAFFLIGILFIYRLSGNLNMDVLFASDLPVSKVWFLAVFLTVSAFIIELKPFPANGWALDVYQTADPGISAMVASIAASGFIYVFYKLIPFIPAGWYNIIIFLGMFTFVFSNLSGLKQKNAQRLLGYSSIAQMGLLMAVLLLLNRFTDAMDVRFALGDIAGALFVNHFLAKAGLYWLSGIIKKENIQDWNLKGYPVLILFFAIFIFALVGLPPFPGFWAKWSLLHKLAQYNLAGWIIPVILGSLLEAAYLLKWFGSTIKKDNSEDISYDFGKIFPVTISAMVLLVIFPTFSPYLKDIQPTFFLPLMAAAGLWLLEFLGPRMRGMIMIALLGFFGWMIYPLVSGIALLFEFIFIVGGIIISIGALANKENRTGLFEFLLLLITSLALIPVAKTTIEFFFAWEMMTISSWLLVLRGKNGEKPAMTYILFSLGAALLILTGFALAFAETGSIKLIELARLQLYATPVYILLAIGFLVKSAALGFHIWQPAAYAESDNDVTPIFSGLMSKIGIWGFIILTGYMGSKSLGFIQITYLLGWIGVITAFLGALMAAFQEDIKYLLAYSSMSQVGYMILSVSMLSHLGWTTALYLSITHLFFKGMLFIAVAGIVSRIGTTKMYEMGGLIKKMPVSFISVLMAIIAVSGVPPLSGFGGKWLMYSALLEKGWYLQAGLAFFAGAVAFLYLFRLIHTMFLGQMKPRFREIKEASLWYLVPQGIFIAVIMAISMYPNLILKPIMAAVDNHFASSVNWDGYTVITSLGYWNGNAVMMITMGVFIVPLIWLLTRVKMVQKVEQFNIVYAAERPDRPETTHVAYNFFAHYQKALGFLVSGQAGRFWKSVAEWSKSLSGTVRHLYTGNAQTYALHIIIYLVVFYALLGVK